MNKSNRIGSMLFSLSSKKSNIRECFMLFSLCSNKRGVAGEMVMMLWRLFLIAIIAFVVLGVSSIVYSYDINVRDVEARIMARNIVNCLVEDLVLDVGDITGNEEMLYSVISFCGYSGDLDRYYVRVEVNQSDGKSFVLSQGDSGAEWVRDITASVDDYELYSPGYYRSSYSVGIGKEGERDVSSSAEMIVEVLVNADV